jgi:hypothetical protein
VERGGYLYIITPENSKAPNCNLFVSSLYYIVHGNVFIFCVIATAVASSPANKQRERNTL